MTGRKIAAKLHNEAPDDHVLPFWTEDDHHAVWAHLGQHIHPHDIETQRAVRQNNGSIIGTTQALDRARNLCPRAQQAFAWLARERPLGAAIKEYLEVSPSGAEALAFNGLKEELVALDIHEDHYAPHRGSRPAREAFAHVRAADFRALVAHNPNLTRIEITCAPLSHAFVDAMVAGLSGHPVRELILHHCSLTSEDLLALLEHMGPTLQHLDLSYNNFSDRSFGALDFSVAPELRVLDLSHCNFDLADLDLTACVQLRSLNLSSNAGGASFLMGHDIGAMPLLQVLQLNRTQLVGGSLSHLDVSTNRALHTLDLGYNALRNDDMHKFCVATDGALKRLNVSGNAIGAEGFVTLQKKGIATLQELDFADNDLHDYSRLVALHQPSLASWPELQWLDLAGCGGITRTTVVALGLHLAPQLSFLDLSATQLHDEAFAALPWAQMPALRCFRAEYSHVSKEGIAHAAFEACPTLVEMDLQHHGMGRIEALEAFLAKAWQNLTTLWLGQAFGGPDADEADTADTQALAQPLLERLRARLGPQGAVAG